MRLVIYGMSSLIILVTLLAGLDNFMGPEVRTFSVILFFAWIVQVTAGNWKSIKMCLK